MFQFNTIEEMTTDADVIQEVKDQIHSLTMTHASRPIPEPGMKYRRTFVDRMGDADHLTADYFLKQIGAIWSKKSKHLNAEERHVIGQICETAVIRVIQDRTRTAELLKQTETKPKRKYTKRKPAETAEA